MKTMNRLGLVLGISVVLAACSARVVREPAGPKPGANAADAQAGASVVVQRGDTLFGIATRNGVSVLDLASWNSLAPPYTIYPGQRLRLSPRGPAAPPAGTRPPAKTPVAERPARVPPATKPAPVRPVVAAPVTTPAPAEPPVASGFAWRWPADGSLIGRFVAGDPTRQGIDIAGSGGAPVRAAADGTVVYSGAGLVGYGELVIIRHNDQWLSAYGHNRRRLVNEGELVKAGQQIAEMGRSGAPRDMLHFEIRHNGRPTDPLKFLPPR